MVTFIIIYQSIAIVKPITITVSLLPPSLAINQQALYCPINFEISFAILKSMKRHRLVDFDVYVSTYRLIVDIGECDGG